MDKQKESNKKWSVYYVEAAANNRKDVYFRGYYYLDNQNYSQEEFGIDIFRGTQSGKMHFWVSFNSKTKKFQGQIVFTVGSGYETTDRLSGKERLLITEKEFSLIITKERDRNNPKDRKGRHWKSTEPFENRFRWDWLRQGESDGASYFENNTDPYP